jgi:hypothetical protein
MLQARIRTLLYVLSLMTVFITVHQACAAEKIGFSFVGDGFYQPTFEISASSLAGFTGPSWQGNAPQTLMDYEAVLGRYELTNKSYVDFSAGFQQAVSSSFHSSFRANMHGVKLKVRIIY